MNIHLTIFTALFAMTASGQQAGNSNKLLSGNSPVHSDIQQIRSTCQDDKHRS